jgi:hypothetical protein
MAGRVSVLAEYGPPVSQIKSVEVVGAVGATGEGDRTVGSIAGAWRPGTDGADVAVGVVGAVVTVGGIGARAGAAAAGATVVVSSWTTFKSVQQREELVRPVDGSRHETVKQTSYVPAVDTSAMAGLTGWTMSISVASLSQKASNRLCPVGHVVVPFRLIKVGKFGVNARYGPFVVHPTSLLSRKKRRSVCVREKRDRYVEEREIDMVFSRTVSSYRSSYLEHGPLLEQRPAQTRQSGVLGKQPSCFYNIKISEELMVFWIGRRMKRLNKWRQPTRGETDDPFMCINRKREMTCFLIATLCDSRFDGMNHPAIVSVGRLEYFQLVNCYYQFKVYLALGYILLNLL